MVWIWFWLARVVHGTSVGCGVFFFFYKLQVWLAVHLVVR